MDIQELISYIHQLQAENKELQKHIFNIQQQIDEKNQAIILANQRRDELAEHIRKCENQIIKRQERQVHLIDNISSLKQQIEIYVEELNRLRKQLPAATKDRQKEEPAQIEKLNATPKLLKMPPKSHQKCRNCEALANERDLIYVDLLKEREKCYMLTRDIQCMIGTYCEV